MKDKIRKLFFEEEIVFTGSDIKVDQDAEYLIKEEDINWISRFIKGIILIFLIHHISQLIVELVFPYKAYSLAIVHKGFMGFIIVFFLNILGDYFYIKEMVKNSKNNFNKKIKNKIKFMFISILIIGILGFFNIGYGIFQLIKTTSVIYYFTIGATIFMFIISIILGTKLVNYLFKQFDKLNEETDGIV